MRKKALLIVTMLSLISILVVAVASSATRLRKTDGVINVLLLGVGGDGHDGPQLTDTIIFASIHPEKNRITLISIPRDLWIPQAAMKINSVYESEGLSSLRQLISRISNQPIHYVALMDFRGFVKAIDVVGGVTLTVERSFDDFEYPDEERKEDLCGRTIEEASVRIATQSPTIVFPCRYHHVHFDKGVQSMDGKRALIFVRSRYAKGDEGTDFARSKRQQKVIKAFWEKLLTPSIFLNPFAIAKLYDIFQRSVMTDVKSSELLDFLELAQKMRRAQISSSIIDESLLVNPSPTFYEGLWVLIPRKGNDDFSEIQAYVSCLLTFTTCEIR